MSSSSFESFWQAYPKKVGKAAALKKWEVKKLDDHTILIVGHVKQRAKDDKRWKDGFILDPATFLNQERWNDEYEKIQHKAPVSTRQADLSAPVYPQTCHWRGLANRVLMEVLLSVKGVSSDKLPTLVAMKNKMGDRMRSLYGDGEMPNDDWAKIKAEGYAWLRREAV